MRISDWSSDVCSSDLRCEPDRGTFGHDEQRDRGEDRAGEEIGAAAAEATEPGAVAHMADDRLDEQPGQRQIGRASGRETVCQYVEISVVAVSLKKTKTAN